MTEEEPEATLRTRLTAWFVTVVVTARRQRWGVLGMIAVVALGVGIFTGRMFAADPGPEARAAIEANVLPVALDADGIWTAGGENRAPVSDALVALRGEDDPRLVDRDTEAWLDAYDAAILRIAGADLPDLARPVQRQFLTAVTFSRDAVEVLAYAAEVEDDAARYDLVTEVGRLRNRSEQLMQSARASTADLDGRRTDLAPLPPLRGFLEAHPD